MQPLYDNWNLVSFFLCGLKSSDNVIESYAGGLSVAEIFQTLKEEGFRKLEVQIQQLHSVSQCILFKNSIGTHSVHIVHTLLVSKELSEIPVFFNTHDASLGVFLTWAINATSSPAGETVSV